VIATFLSGSRARWALAWLVPVVLLLCAPSRAGAARPSLVMLPASGRGVSARIIERARHLFVESLGQRDRFHVTDYDRPPTADRANAQEAVMTAQLTGVTIAVALDLSHEGADTIFDVHCWDGASGESRCHVREKTAAGPDLLPDFTEWLAMRLVRELDASPDTAVPSDGYMTKPLREPRMFTFGARTSLMVPFDSPSRRAAMIIASGASGSRSRCRSPTRNGSRTWARERGSSARTSEARARPACNFAPRSGSSGAATISLACARK